jgi:mRNA-degrading endonuclease RelE of RelBE toxin-antitoxin system
MLPWQRASSRFARLSASITRAAPPQRRRVPAAPICPKRHLPDALSGLCKLRLGGYRILYWVYHSQKLIRLYRVQHRSPSPSVCVALGPLKTRVKR